MRAALILGARCRVSGDLHDKRLCQNPGHPIARRLILHRDADRIAHAHGRRITDEESVLTAPGNDLRGGRPVLRKMTEEKVRGRGHDVEPERREVVG